MQSVSSRIWTCVAMSISYNDNHNNMGTSIITDRFAKQISLTVQRYYFSANVQVAFNTKPILTSIRKDILPSHHNNSFTY